MNRRQALQQASLLLGGAIIGSQAFLNSSFTFHRADSFLSKRQIQLLNEIGETILPETDTPGAKAADVGTFMSVIVADCYTPEEQKIFLDGLVRLEKEAHQNYGKDFLKLLPTQREALLGKIDKDHIAYMKESGPGAPPHYFRMFKELTLTGYFTSEVGATKFLNYHPAPGRYDGCTTEKPWH